MTELPTFASEAGFRLVIFKLFSHLLIWVKFFLWVISSSVIEIQEVEIMFESKFIWIKTKIVQNQIVLDYFCLY